MADNTRLSPTAGVPGGDYGSFVKGGGAHDPGPLTELSPTGGLPGGLYGDFTGKASSGAGALTELSGHAGLPGGLHGSFTGKEPHTIPPVVVPGAGGGGAGPDHFPPTRRREPRPARIIEGYLLAQEAPDGLHCTGDVYESELQIRTRRNARALRIILLNS